ncbi:aldo/keto reductase [Microvirga antarctica]|uniref:aldo/keto reductase n=1 Tax=Microvirga antarctica TaxID=2819233 RepID=UPI001B3033B6|nr:aldo/keto reductase [Microvirga antarctica]
MHTQPMVELSDGRSIPQLGFGVWRIPEDETSSVVQQAIAAGYRSIDTAAIYQNERGVGLAIQESPVDRSELFITTKLWNEEQGFDTTMRACTESLRKLQLDSVDLYLIHWPLPKRDRYLDTWRAFIRLREEGKAKSIGVSNFTVATLQRLMDDTGVAPVLNQIELHPRFQQRELREFHAKHGIATESWSPLGRGAFHDPAIAAIAEKHGKSPAQIVLRWHLDSGLIVIPKSTTPARIRENFDLFGFTLDSDDMAAIAKLDDPAGRVGSHPDTME